MTEIQPNDPRLHPLISRPIALCNYIESKLPRVFRFIERRREERARRSSWERWAYAPADIVDDVVVEYRQSIAAEGVHARERVKELILKIHPFLENDRHTIRRLLDNYSINHARDLAAFALTAAAWRYGGKHVFVLHDELLSTLLNGSIAGQTFPMSVLQQLPYWSGYIPLANSISENRSLTTGLTKITLNADVELKGILFALAGNGDGSGALFLIPDIFESQEISHPLVVRLPITEMLSVESLLLDGIAEEPLFQQINERVTVPFLATLTRIALQPILYLCAANAEARLATPPALAAPPRPRGSARDKLVAPQKETVWAVGYRIGAALQAARRQTAGEGQNTTAGTESGRTVRPHIRRAHWHGYRVGPGRSGWKVIWLPPIPVNLSLQEDQEAYFEHLPVTQRSVGEGDKKGKGQGR